MNRISLTCGTILGGLTCDFVSKEGKEKQKKKNLKKIMDEIFPNLKKAINADSRSSTKSKQDKSLWPWARHIFLMPQKACIIRKKLINMKIENFTELSVGEHAVKWTCITC